MSHGGDLLRLLMPAVSPVPTRDAPRPDAQPIESRSFESLLEEANRIDFERTADDTTGSAEPAEAGEKPRVDNTLAGLSGIDSIQNASLRQIIAGASGSK